MCVFVCVSLCVFVCLCACLHVQIEYFLRKLTEAMGGSWVEERFEDYKLQLNSKQQCLNAWELISLVGSGHFSKGMDHQTLSMGIGEVYQELILDVLKQVGSTSAQTDGTVFIAKLCHLTLISNSADAAYCNNCEAYTTLNDRSHRFHTKLNSTFSTWQ